MWYLTHSAMCMKARSVKIECARSPIGKLFLVCVFGWTKVRRNQPLAAASGSDRGGLETRTK